MNQIQNKNNARLRFSQKAVWRCILGVIIVLFGIFVYRLNQVDRLMVPTASIVLIWQVLFDYNGVVNLAVQKFGGGQVDWLKSSAGLFVVILLFLWKNLGYNMILFLSAMGNIPKDIIEVAELDGANRWQIFIHVKLRYLSPTIMFVTILSMINSFICAVSKYGWPWTARRP